MSTTTFQLYKGVHTNDPTLPIANRSAIIDGRTQSVIDFRSKYAYSGSAGAIPIGTQIKDLVKEAPPHLLESSIPFDGKGLVFDIGQRRMRLSDRWKIPADATDIAWGFWLKLKNTDYTRAGHSIAGYKREVATAGYQWLLSLNTNIPTNGGLKNIQFGVNGRVATYVTASDDLTQVVARYRIVNAGAEHFLDLYVGGVLVATTTTVAYARIDPEVSSFPAVGQFTPSFPDSFAGVLLAQWFQRLDTPGRSLAEIMAIDLANPPELA